MNRKLVASSLAIVAIVAIASIAVWRWQKPNRATTSPSSPSATPATVAPVSPLGLRLRVAVGDPAASAMLTVTLFNRASRQAALSRDTEAGRAGRPVAPAPAPIRVDFPADGWLSRMQIAELRADGTKSPINSVTIRQAPAAVSLEGDATAEIHLEVPVSSLPPAGAKLVATFRSDAALIESDPAEVPPAASGALTAALADARVARVAGDTDRLARAAAIIERVAPQSVDAPYYRGLVQEARGEREAALASYRRALDRAGRGRQAEPPDELVFLIRRLQNGRR